MRNKADITVGDLASGGGLRSPEQVGGMMPITRCRLPNGEMGYKWGEHGTCYASRSGAERQAAAAHASGYTGKEDAQKLEEAQQKMEAEELKLAAMGGAKKRRRRYRY